MDIRQKFLDYFARHQHQHVESSSLVPHGDATLLFTNAGMNQFKDVFLGQEQKKYSRAASSQKCVRAGGKHNDLENVGRTARHHTFFEMLGNFSFGDYFKKQAIELAWRFITEELGLDQSRLYVTVFLDDDQAFSIWRDQIGIDTKRIFRFGEKDNFWSMGDTGPCGPCSEIFYDQAPDGTLPDSEQFATQDDRFMEIWNLVFMQYMQHTDGRREALPNPSIDTGMGLERITAVLEGKTNNYDSSLFAPILTFISKHSQADYFSGATDAVKVSQRVLADHIRAMVFLIADGVLPSKDGRGYVLRRIMRRAMRHGRKIDFVEHGLSQLSEVVIEHYASAYPELADKQKDIIRAIYDEETLFSQTVDRGMHLLMEVIEKNKAAQQAKFDGETAFHLYDTYGFPIDMTADVLREHDLVLDQQGFEQAFANHRKKARGSWKGNDLAELEAHASSWHQQNMQSKFLGYDLLEADAKVVALIKTGSNIETAAQGDEVSLLLDQTPFYGESGGQVGDVGSMTFDGGHLEVLRTHKIGQEFIVHDVLVGQGSLRIGSAVRALVAPQARSATAKNHTATHILHATLKEVFGDHVEQRGSLVSPERLRFDFAHGKALSKAEQKQITQIINDRIAQDDAIITEVLAIKDAKQTGAVSMFGEKYGDTVRVLSLGDYSKEFCGGTHVQHSGEIETFVLTKESSVSAGVRRIEALTGKRATAHLQAYKQIIKALAKTLSVDAQDLVTQVTWMQQARKELGKKGAIQTAREGFIGLQIKDTQETIEQLAELLRAPADQLVVRAKALQDKLALATGSSQAQDIELDQSAVTAHGEVPVLVQEVSGVEPKGLRSIADRFMENLGQGIVVLGMADTEKAYLVVKVAKVLTKQYHAGNLVKLGAATLGGSGGGRPDFAQAGGTDLSKLAQALETIQTQILM